MKATRRKDLMMRLRERTGPARTMTLDLNLAQKAERKLNRYNMDLNGVLAFIVAVRGLPDLRNAPQTIDFTAHGQTFTADVKSDPDGGYCATVRGHDDCFTEADTLPELRKYLVEVTEAMVFGMGEKVVR